MARRRSKPLGPTNIGRGVLGTNTSAIQLAQQRAKLWSGLPQYLAQQHTPGVMSGQAPKAGAPPVASPPGQPQQPGTPFVPDAQYLAEAAQRQFDRTQAMTALTSQGTTDKGDTSEALRRMLAKAPEERQGIKEGSNRQGLFYSGQLGKRLTDYQTDLTQRQGDVQHDFDTREAARAAARAALEQGRPLEEAAALAEAATRQVDRDSAAAASNALVLTPAAPAPRVAAGRRPAPPRRRPAKRRR
jgi:hypothetical protein